jgi:hypothetical protein
MKKIFLLLLSLVFTCSLVYAEAFFSEDFSNISDWTIVNGPNNTANLTWENGNSGVNALTGSNGTFLSCDSDYPGSGFWVQSTITSNVIDCSGYSNVHLEFIHYYRHLGSQFGKVYVIDNADTAHLVATYNSSTTNGQAVNIDISSIADNSAIRIAFEFDDNNGWNWYWLIDNLKLDGIMAGAPGMVTNPNPAHLATNVPLNGSLTWDFGADTEFYDLWFGTVGNMTEVVSGEASAATGSYDYSNLTEFTTYQWQVISHKPSKVSTPGPIWSFTTEMDSGIAIGNGDINWNYPFSTYYMDARTQTIYLSSEFNGGYVINSVLLNVDSIPGQALSNFYIRMKETPASEFENTNFDNTGLTQVLYLSNYEITATGWVVFNLDSPFLYTGENNLLVDYVIDNSSYTSDGYAKAFDSGSYRSLYYRTDSSSGNVLDQATGTRSMNVNNVIFMGESFVPGTLDGYVYSVERAPLIGAQVEILGTIYSQQTDENGYFSFPFLQAGTYDVLGSAFAHYDDTMEGITVLEGETTSIELYLERFPTVTVSGFVAGSDFPSVGLEGALVELTGFDNYETQTDANGDFFFPEVYADNSYNIEISYPGFSNYSGVEEVGSTNFNAGTFILDEIATPVGSVTASRTAQETALITWTLPGIGGGEEQWIHYDDGINADGVGTGGVSDFDVAIRFEPSQLEDFDSMYLTKMNFFPMEANCEYSIRVWTGANAANLIVDQLVASPIISAWNEIQLQTPVQIDATEELWLGYRANTQTGYPAGCDAGPAVTGSGDMILFNGAWVSINEEFGLNYNWNIQGWVSNSAKGNYATNILPNDSRMNSGALSLGNAAAHNSKPASTYSRFNQRALEMFTIYRLLEGEEQDEAYWVNLGSVFTPETELEDVDFASLPAGMYKYAVKAVYTNDLISPPTFSNNLPLGLHSVVTVNVSSNSGDAVTGAMITLTNNNGNEEYIYQMEVPESGTAVFPAVWKGAYTIEIHLAGFENYSAQVPLFNDEATYNAQLIEAFFPPVNLSGIAGNGLIDLAWDAPILRNNPKADMRGLESYNVYRNNQMIDSVTGDERIYQDNGVANGNSYQYYVTAVYTTGESDSSNVVEIYLPHYSNLSGTVYDVNQSPISGATIHTGQFSTETDANGDYLLELPLGVYEITCSKEDYVSSTETDVSIVLNETTTLDFNLNLLVPSQLEYQVQDFNNVFLSWNEPSIPGNVLLHYDDGINFDAIGTGGAADFDVAIRFEPNQISEYDGDYLTKIDFFPREANCEYSVRVWQGANASTLMADQLVASPVINEWNSVTLESPVQIDATQELWFGYRSNTQAGNPAGCDAGPAVTGFGDMIFFGGSWASINNAYGLNYNWNIQGYVTTFSKGSPASPIAKLNSQTVNKINKINPEFSIGNLPIIQNRALIGYNIYRDGILIANNVQELSFTDMGLSDGMYSYYVTAVFDGGESNPTNTVNVTIQAGNVDVILFEDFEEGIIPSAWTMTTNSAIGWFVTLDGSSSYWNIPEGDGYYACSNDDEANDDSSLDYLITPMLNLSSYELATLQFRSYFTGSYSQTAHVKVSMDGANWTEIGTVPTATEWIDVTIDLSDYATPNITQLWINFHANDNSAWASGWAIDDVLVSGVMSGTPEYGNLAGFVNDYAGNSVSGALVKANKYTLEYSTYSEADGSYEFNQLPIGNYTLRALAEHYQEGVNENVEILAGQTTDFDINLFDVAYPPTNVVAVHTEDENAEITWTLPEPSAKTNFAARPSTSTGNVLIDRALESFNIFRLLEGNEEFTDVWELVGSVPSSETSFTEFGFGDLSQGVYRFAVTAVYSGQIMSSPAFSNTLPVKMHSLVTLNVSTNSGDPVEGASVRLMNQDNNPEHIYSEIVTGMSAIFPAVWKGEYQISIHLAGFEIYYNEIAILNETESFDSQLIELFISPTDLTYEVEESMVHLNWTAPSWIGDELDEGFENGLLPDGWLAIDNDNDGENWFLYEDSPHSGNWSIASASWWQSVVLTPDNYLITPQIDLGSYNELRFWVAAQEPAYPAEHYKVLLSSAGTAPADFNVVLFEETLADVVWKEIVVDLSAYANQSVHLAWQHTDSSDMFVMKLDDISVVNAITREIVFASNFETMANHKTSIKPTQKFEKNRSLLGYNIYRDGYAINDSVVENLTFTDSGTTNDFTHSYYVTAVYTTGESGSTNTVEAYVPPKVATPVFSPNPELIYTEPIAVTIETTTENATIQYRFVESDIRSEWFVYEQPIELDFDTVTAIEAKGFKDEWASSDVAFAEFTITGTVAAPTFSPAPSLVYTEPVNVILETETEGATIEYRFVGDFKSSYDWTTYVEPIALDYDTVTNIQARASKVDWLTSDIVSETYTVTGTVATPTFSPSPDAIYTEPIQVVLATETDGATIEYQFAGQKTWTVYTEPIQLAYDSVTTIEARASKENWITSDIASATYTITGTVATPTFSPTPDVIYTEPIAVILETATVGAYIEYRLNNEPTWIAYSDSIQLNYDSVTTIEARATKEDWITSSISTATYTVTGTVATPTFSPVSEIIYTDVISVTLESETADALIEYKIVGDLKSYNEWTTYTTPIELGLDTTTTIEARASKENWITSDIASATYTITGTVEISSPYFDVEPGIYQTAQTVAVIANSYPEDATIRYTTDGSAPDEYSTVYSEPIEVPLNTTMEIKIRAFKENWLPSGIYSGVYNVTGTVAAPTFLPNPEVVYTEPVSVILETETEGATIEYQFTGQKTWTVYTEPIQLGYNSVTTLEARASKENWITSDIASTTYTVTGTVATPTFLPYPDGFYNDTIEVSIQTETEGAAIFYRFAEDLDWLVYIGPIFLDYNTVTTLEAMASKENWVDSDIATATYSIIGKVATPTFSPNPEIIYTEPIEITIQTDTENAILEFRTSDDAGETWSEWQLYENPIDLGYDSSINIEAKASKDNWLDSEIAYANYLVTSTVATPTFNPAPGLYYEAIDVVINSATDGATVHYRSSVNNGTWSDWDIYTSPISIPVETDVDFEAYATKELCDDSEIAYAAYSVTNTAVTPTFSPEPSVIYTEPIAVTLQTETEEATIEYRIAPDENWLGYTAPIQLDYDSITTIEARTTKENWGDSEIVSETYTITGTVAAPTFSYESGIYTEPISVTLETTTEGATIEYQIAGQETWVVYTEPIELENNTVTSLEARASKENWVTSDIVSETYTITGTVAAPTFSHESGVYTEPISVTLETTTEGATIEYQIAGQKTWVVYTEPIQIENNTVTTIEARASKENWITSDIVSETYTITGTVAAPTFSHESGVYTEPISVTLETATEGAIIEYQLAGQKTWVVYTEPIELENNTVTTIEARASKENWITSDIVSATYTITGTVAAPTFSHESGVYTEPISITLETTTEGATIEYQIAGQKTWVVYTEPIQIGYDSVTSLEARASKENWVTSDIVSETYTITGAVAAPTFSHESGVYTEPIAVTIETTTEGATIEYQIAGQKTWVVYTEPIELDYNTVTTIEARASKDNWITSDIVSETYTITGTVAAPTFSYESGIYTEPIAVTLETTTEGATIEYQIAGQKTWVVYSEPIELDNNTVTTIEARASKENWVTSEIVSETYTITGTVAAPTFSYESGVYTEPIAVTLETTTEGATIEYQIAGQKTWVIYTEPIELDYDSVTTIEARASKENWVTSDIVSETYTITGTVAAPTFSHESGIYTEPISVTLETTTEGATIEYQIAGQRNWVVYTEPIQLDNDTVTTIEARASKENWVTSDIVSETYTITGTVAAPTFSHESGIYTEPIAVTLETTTQGATIEYQIAGQKTWVVYTEPIELDYNTVTTIEARASKENWITSDIVSETYTITGTVAAPTFSYESGVYTEPIAVTLETTTESATIEYQIAGQKTWVVYTEPIELDYDTVTTIEARASKENWITSEIVSETYTITGTVATPTFSPDGGIYNVEVTVEIFSETDNAMIYYTLNGEEPNENSEIYSAPITLTENTTIKARAYKENWIQSAVATAAYEITGNVAMPSANPPAGAYLVSQMVTLSCATPESEIRFTTDGTEPDQNSDLYEEPISIEYSTVIKAKAYRTNWSPSETLTAEYHILYSPINLAAEVGYLFVNLTWEMPEVPVVLSKFQKGMMKSTRDRETFLGYNLYRNGNLLNEEFILTESFEDIDVDGGEDYNYYVVAVYEEGESNPSNTIYITTPQMVATPEFSPESGYYEEAIDIVISCSTPDATIYYTLDGSEPTHLSEEYVAPLALEGIVHIKARAYKEGWLPSEIAEADYEIVITEAGETILIPTVTALETVYPNPFNPETNIRFSLHETSHVLINVYNAKGQKIRTLLNENKAVGFYNTVWNGKNDSGKSMPSGVYFFVLQTNEQRLVRKAMLLK